MIATVRGSSLLLLEPRAGGNGMNLQGKPKFDRVFDPPHAVSAFEGGACERSGQESNDRGLDDDRRRSSRGLAWRCNLAGAVPNYLEQNLDLAVGRPMGLVARKNLGVRDL